jgi:xanthine dehydrogenase molybdenum-binding subunit
MDPVELRLKNVNKPNSETVNGFKITSCGLEECIRSAADKAGWHEIHGKQGAKKKGIGMGSLIHVGGAARVFGLPGVGLDDGTGTVIKVDDFGKVVVLTGATDIGEGADTVIAQIVAETLGVAYEDVVLHKPDTNSTPFDLGCHASRTTFAAGNSARLAALDAKKQILELAAKFLQTMPEDLELKNGRVLVKSQPDRTVNLVEVLQKSHYNLSNDGQVVIGSAYYEPPNGITDPQTVMGNMSAAYAFGTHMVEVEVDTETGQVKILNFVAAHDTGRTINPLGVRGQTFGGVAQGIGYALTEEVVFKNGKVANPQFLDYKIPTALDMPPIQTIDVETIDPEGPYGAKGVGEPGLVPTAAAIANAVYDAIGVRITDLPITPEKILKALDARG